MKILPEDKEKQLALQPPNGSEHLFKRARARVTINHHIIHSQYISVTSRYQFYKRRENMLYIITRLDHLLINLIMYLLQKYVYKIHW